MKLNYDISTIYFKNKIYRCGMGSAEIYCKKCDTMIGYVKLNYPVCNLEDMNIEISDFCPNCGKKISISGKEVVL